MSVCNVRVKHIRPKYDNLKEWCEDPNNYYIGRRGIVFVDGKRYPPQDSLFANPYKAGRDGTLEEVLAKYRVYIVDKINNGLNIEVLRGKNLGCWCSPNPCHGDILLELLNSKQ